MRSHKDPVIWRFYPHHVPAQIPNLGKVVRHNRSPALPATCPPLTRATAQRMLEIQTPEILRQVWQEMESTPDEIYLPTGSKHKAGDRKQAVSATGQFAD